MLQYRHKSAFTEVRLDEARTIAELCRRAGAIFVMNDRADFARLLGCGLHVGQDDLPAESARDILGKESLIGLSTHNEIQFRAALEQPVNYLALGPVFGTTSKSNPDPEVGLRMITKLRELTHLPLAAIGGIKQKDAPAVLESGADTIAVISALLPERPGNLAALESRASEWLNAVR
jgi:thiamine-phosphate pyrophosphorylase